MITPPGPDQEIFRPDNDEDAARFARLFGAVDIKGMMCRCLTCCCRPGEGHRSAGDASTELRRAASEGRRRLALGLDIAEDLLGQGSAWTPARPGDTPGTLPPGEADTPPPIDIG